VVLSNGKGPCAEELKPHFALFISISMLEVVSVFDYFDGFHDDVGDGKCRCF
jgi:hypothetical protein